LSILVVDTMDLRRVGCDQAAPPPSALAALTQARFHPQPCPAILDAPAMIVCRDGMGIGCEPIPSGASWPAEVVPPATHHTTLKFPSPSAMPAPVRFSQMAASLADLWGQAIVLLGLTGLHRITAALCIARASRPDRPDVEPGTAAEPQAPC
jgi:hypothetical protein